jgi:hypothetical protein
MLFVPIFFILQEDIVDNSLKPSKIVYFLLDVDDIIIYKLLPNLIKLAFEDFDEISTNFP